MDRSGDLKNRWLERGCGKEYAVYSQDEDKIVTSRAAKS